MEAKELYTIDPLFDFQTICDTDIGLYRLIKAEYYDRNVFDNYLFDTKDIRFIKTMLMCRDHFNPLFLFCKKGVYTTEEMDDLYKQFLDEEYEKILKLSPPTAVFELASVSNSVKGIINPTILCARKEEKEWVNEYNDKLKCMIDKFDGLDISKYDTIYIKDIYNLLLIKQDTLTLKNIFISKYSFNLEIATARIELPLKSITQLYYLDNKFYLVDTYKNLAIPVSEMN